MGTTITVIRWVIGGAALAVGCHVIGFNLVPVLRWCLSHRRSQPDEQDKPHRHVSLIPIMGPVFVLAGAWIIPTGSLHRFTGLTWVLVPWQEVTN